MSYMQEQLSKVPASKQWLVSRIEVIKTAPDGARAWLKDLGKNDIEHAEAVEEYAGKILLESNIILCPEELYLLLHAIYTHDTGYRKRGKDHAKASHDAIIEHPEMFFISDENLAKAIAWIALSHGLEDLSQVPSAFPVDFLSKTVEFDLQFLGAMLLLADEMDQAYLRVFNRAGQERSQRNTVYHVEIGPQIVKLKTKPDSSEQWEQLKKITTHIQRRLDGVAPILGRRGVKLEQVTLYPTVWTERPHEEEGSSSFRVLFPRSTRKMFFLLDRTVLGAQVLQRMQLEYESVNVVQVSAAHVARHPLPTNELYSCIIWMLGEDFETPICREIMEMILKNTANGGGLVLFPFVAWSVSQGINDQVQDALPVALAGRWVEGQSQRISTIKPHPITEGIKSFTIKNTYEWLTVKRGAQSIMEGSDGTPFLVAGSFGKGKVAYINASSHLCAESREMVSPWHQSPFVGLVILKTIAWAYET